MITGKFTQSNKARNRHVTLAWMVLLLAVIIVGGVFQTALAQEDTPPAWYRIRTNSVPMSPEEITVDSTGAVWVTCVTDSEYNPGVWRLPSGETRFEYLTNSRANNWLHGDYNNVVEKPELAADVNYVVRDKAGNVWYALNNRTVLVEKADGSPPWQTIAMENTYNEFYGVDTTNVDSAHIIHLIDNQDGSQDVLLVAETNAKRLDPNFNVVDSRLQYISGYGDYIRDVFFDSHGRYWVANEYGVQYGDTMFTNTGFPAGSEEYKNDPEVPPYDPWATIPTSGEPITGIMEDSEGNIWFTNSLYGSQWIYCLTNPNGTNDWIRYSPFALVGASNRVVCMAAGPDGVMWFGTNQESGIITYNPGAATPWSRTPCASLGDIPSEILQGMWYDNGVLWFTTYSNSSYAGVYALTVADSSLESFTYREDSTSLTSNRIDCLAGDLSGGVWFAAYDKPSVARLKADKTWVQYKEDTMDLTYERGKGSIPGIGVDSKNIVYMAPVRRVPIAYDIETEQWLTLPEPSLADPYVYSLYVDPKDGKWLCCSYAVYYLDADNSAWTTYDNTGTIRFPHESGNPSAFYVEYGALMDNDGNMWFMTRYGISLMKMDPEGGDPTWYQYAAGDDTGFQGGYRVVMDKNGQIWNVSNQIFDSSTDTWTTQTDTTLFDTRPLRFLNGDIPADVELEGAPEQLGGTAQERMTVDTAGNVFFGGGMFWLQSINKGVVVCTPVKGDIDRDGKIELGDAILSMGSLAGMASGIQSAPVDVTGDGKVDTAESIYVLQKVAGLR